MTPHSAALLTVAAYLKRGGSGSSFRVRLQGYHGGTYKIHNVGGYKWKTEKDGDTWSCTCHLEIQGDKVTIRDHHHIQDTPLQEVAYFSATGIEGSTSMSRFGYAGSFRASYKEYDGSKLTVYGTKGTYETELTHG